MKKPLPKVLLIGLHLTGEKNPVAWPVATSLKELAELCVTAGLEVAATVVQNRATPNPGFYFGSGKIAELTTMVQEQNIEVLIADDELTPLQQKNLEETMQIKIMDRTSLILDIFAKHARTHEAQLQVEYAQLEYMRPRLTHMWQHLSRLGGGIGTRGPGEKQIEVDKRRIRERLSTIQDKLEKIKQQRTTRRLKRTDVPVLTGVIVGYTNAGKSTLLNRLTGATVLVADQLFATLDPTVRRLRLPNRDELLLTDTVGFIQKLPHQLVSSFRATLEETSAADFLIHVIDVANPNFPAALKTAKDLLHELGAGEQPVLYVFNKVDQVAKPAQLTRLLRTYQPHVVVSALNGQHQEQLITALQSMLSVYRKKMHCQIPNHRMDIVHLLHKHGQVLQETYGEQTEIEVEINAIIGEKILGQLQ